MTMTMSFTNLGEWLARREDLTPDKIALVDCATGTRLSYRDLNARVRTLAAWLQRDQHILPGDRVAMLALNAPEYLDAFFACALIGAIFVPLNWRLTAPELAQILSDGAPKVLLHDSDHADAASAAITALMRLQNSAAHATKPRGLFGVRREKAEMPALPALIPVASLPGADPALAAQVEPLQKPCVYLHLWLFRPCSRPVF